VLYCDLGPVVPFHSEMVSGKVRLKNSPKVNVVLTPLIIMQSCLLGQGLMKGSPMQR
jgi:hypothetical protein